MMTPKRSGKVERDAIFASCYTHRKVGAKVRPLDIRALRMPYIR